MALLADIIVLIVGVVLGAIGAILIAALLIIVVVAIYKYVKNRKNTGMEGVNINFMSLQVILHPKMFTLVQICVLAYNYMDTTTNLLR